MTDHPAAIASVHPVVAEDSGTEQIVLERRGPGGRLAVLVLNRPRQLNALSHVMIRTIAATLARWRDDDSVEQVLLVGAGERGLCAGGDIAEVRDDFLNGDGSQAAEFLADEYRLDAATAEYPKPYVALMDGFTFGGGVGLSGHSTRRIVTERSRIAMPETAIGFVPDIGGTWLLGRMPGLLGLHAALTGHRLDAADAIATGFADHYVRAERIPRLVELLETEHADAAIAAVEEAPPASSLVGERLWIDAAYAHEEPHDILHHLEALASTEPLAAQAAAAIRAASPTAVAATLELVRRSARVEHLRRAIDLEYRVGMRLVAEHDFLEGVRAMLIDKDRDPKWRPATLEAVDPHRIQELFDPVGALEIDWSLGPLGPAPHPRRE